MCLEVRSDDRRSCDRAPSSEASNSSECNTQSRRGIWLTMLALAAVIALTSHPPVEAAPTTFRLEARPLVRAMTPALDRLAQAEIAPRSPDEVAACYKIRKRLWDGEGWIVRRVSICR